jgi:toxin ParE1/3/4
MKVIIRESADEDLDRIFEWIAKDNRSAAAKMVAKIRDRINLLEIDSLAKMGRPGLVTGTRELIEYPYIIVYEVDSGRQETSVLTILHGARNRRDPEK